MNKVNISIKINEDLKGKVDSIAKLEDRDRSYIINKAVNNYIELYEWQINKIEKAIKQVDNGEFVTEQEVKKLFDNLVNSK